MTRKNKHRESKAKKIYLLRKIWGPSVPTFPGSVYEGEDVDDAEVVLHELAHQVLLPKRFVFTPGRMMRRLIDAHSVVSDYIDELPRWRRDVHEIKAIAIELVTAKLLRLRLSNKRLIRHSRRNTELYRPLSKDRAYSRIVRRAMKTESVLTHAETIMVLIDQERKKL